MNNEVFIHGFRLERVYEAVQYVSVGVQRQNQPVLIQ